MLVKSAFYVSIPNLLAEIFRWKEIFHFFIFVNWVKDFRPSGKNFRRVRQNSFLWRSLSLSFEDCFFFKNFFKYFGLWVNFVPACLQNYSAWLSKLHSVYHRDIEEKWNCLRKKFLSFSHIDVNFSGFLEICFERRCGNCFLLVHLNLWEKCFLMRNFLSFIFEGWAKISRLRRNYFSPGSSILHSATKSKRKIWGNVFSLKNLLFSFSDIERKFFGLLSNSFCQRCQSRFFHRSPKNFLVEIPFFTVFGHSMNNLRHLVDLFFGNDVKTAFYESIGTFWAKLINWKGTFVFLIFGNCAKFFRPPGKSYRRGHVNSFLRRRPK